MTQPVAQETPVNPWLTATPEPAPSAEASPAESPAPWAAGSVPGYASAAAVDVVAVSGPGLYVMGAHGGAGASTLAHLLGVGETGRCWPVAEGGGVRVLVCARTSAAGIRAAQDLAVSWGGLAGGSALAGVVWVPDQPGRLPRSLKEQVSLISGGYPSATTLPFFKAWRMHPDPASRPVAEKFVQSLRSQFLEEGK